MTINIPMYHISISHISHVRGHQSSLPSNLGELRTKYFDTPWIDRAQPG